MKSRILVPPLIASIFLSAAFGIFLGGPVLLWLFVAWLGAVPLTLIWMRILTHRKPAPPTPKPALQPIAPRRDVR